MSGVNERVKTSLSGAANSVICDKTVGLRGKLGCSSKKEENKVGGALAARVDGLIWGVHDPSQSKTIGLAASAVGC